MAQYDWSNLGPLESVESEGRLREQALAVIPGVTSLSMESLQKAAIAELLANINAESESDLGASPIDAVLAAGNDAGAQQITNIADATDDADVPSRRRCWGYADRKSTRLNSSHVSECRMPPS